MPLRISGYNPDRGLAMLKMALGEKDANENTPGRVPSGIAENEYFGSIPNTNEQEREAGILDNLDAGASARQQAELNQYKSIDMAKTGARAMGFEDPRAQAEDAFQKLMTPERMKLQAAEKGADEARTYSSLEHDKDRQVRQDIVAAQQGGQNQRQTTAIGQQNNVIDQKAQAQYAKDHSILNFFHIGRPTAGVGNTAGSAVQMMDPDTKEVRSVPASQVQQAISIGLVEVK